MSLSLAVVTATTNLARALPCIKTWCVPEDVPLIIQLNGQESELNEQQAAELNTIGSKWILQGSSQILGTVPAFRRGVSYALKHTKADVIACFHDDVEIHIGDWIVPVLRHFKERPFCGLAGFGGAIRTA